MSMAPSAGRRIRHPARGIGSGLLPLLVLMGACAREPASREAPAPDTQAQSGATPESRPTDEALLAFESRNNAVYVTNRDAGRTLRLFEDEKREGSDEGTWHRLLSSFGPYVSYSTEWHHEGLAHPSHGKTWDAVSVRETIERADLRRIFPERAIYEALQKTPLVVRTPLKHDNLEELLNGLAGKYPCEMDFDTFFSSFHVREVRAETAVVAVGLTHGCETHRGSFTTLTLNLGVPPEARELFGDFRSFNNTARSE